MVTKNNHGFLTLELLIAMAILATVLFAVTFISFSSQSFMIDSQNTNDALSKAQAFLEEAKNNAKIDFDLVQDVTSVDGMFTKELVVTELDAITKKIAAEVSWDDGQKHVELYTIIANLSNGPGANTCSAIRAGNWTSPRTQTFRLSSLWQAEDPEVSNGIYTITGLDAYLGRLYVTVDSAGTAGVINSQRDFFMLNLSNPLSPTLFGGSDNDTGTATGLTTVRTSGNYAYTVSASGTNGQLHIFDITYNPPRLIESLQVASGVVGTSLFYKNDYLYLGLANNTGGSEFFIIDVEDPESPSVVGTAEIGAGVSDIYVHTHFAYVATTGSDAVKVFDVTTPSMGMQAAGVFTSPQAVSSGVNQASRLAVVDDRLYVGRTQGTNELYILNKTTPASLTSLGAIDLAGSANIFGLAIRDELAFLATTAGQVLMYNISNPAASTSVGSAISLGNPARALDCEGNYIYVASNDASGNGYITVITGN